MNQTSILANLKILGTSPTTKIIRITNMAFVTFTQDYTVTVQVEVEADEYGTLEIIKKLDNLDTFL